MLTWRREAGGANANVRGSRREPLACLVIRYSLINGPGRVEMVARTIA
jgi:hypothetical protein